MVSIDTDGIYEDGLVVSSVGKRHIADLATCFRIYERVIFVDRSSAKLHFCEWAVSLRFEPPRTEVELQPIQNVSLLADEQV